MGASLRLTHHSETSALAVYLPPASSNTWLLARGIILAPTRRVAISLLMVDAGVIGD